MQLRAEELLAFDSNSAKPQDRFEEALRKLLGFPILLADQVVDGLISLSRLRNVSPQFHGFGVKHLVDRFLGILLRVNH